MEELQKSLSLKSQELEAKNALANQKLKQMVRRKFIVSEDVKLVSSFKLFVLLFHTRKFTKTVRSRLLLPVIQGKLACQALISENSNFVILMQVKDQQEAEKKKVTSIEIQATIEVRNEIFD